MTFELGPNALAAILALISLACSAIALIRARENMAVISQHDVRIDAVSSMAQHAIDNAHNHKNFEV